MRSAPPPTSSASRSRTSHWSAVSTPPGTLVRTIAMVGQVLAGLGAGSPLVAIVLLVDAVELQEHLALGGEALGAVGQLGGEVTTKVIARSLDLLRRARGWPVRRGLEPSADRT